MNGLYSSALKETRDCIDTLDNLHQSGGSRPIVERVACRGCLRGQHRPTQAGGSRIARRCDFASELQYVTTTRAPIVATATTPSSPPAPNAGGTGAAASRTLSRSSFDYPPLGSLEARASEIARMVCIRVTHRRTTAIDGRNHRNRFDDTWRHSGKFTPFDDRVKIEPLPHFAAPASECHARDRPM